MKRTLASGSISFGVVPDEIRLWKPETAPQAMVMNRNGKSAPAQTGPLPSTNFVIAGIFEAWRDEQDAEGEANDRADLQENREIVARREQEPNRQDRGDHAVADEQPAELRSGEGEIGGERRVLGDALAIDDRQHQQDKADDRDLTDGARPDEAHVDAHEDRDRDGGGDGERAPRAVGERLDDDQRQDRQE